MALSKDAQHPLGSTQWLVVAAIVAAAVIAAMQLGKSAPALPAIADDLGIDMLAAGWVASIANLIGAIAGGIAGFMADRIGNRRTIVLGLLFLAGGALLAVATESIWLLLLARALEGAGLLAMFVAGTPFVVAASAARDRGLVLGIWSAFFPLGFTLIVAASAGLLGPLGWRGFFSVNAVLCVLTLIAFILVVSRGRVVEARPPSLGGTGRVMATPGPWLLSAMFLVMGIASFAVQTWLPSFLFEELNLSIEVAALASAAFIFLFVPANIIGSHLSDWRRIQRWHIMAFGSLGIVVLPFGIFADGLGDTARAIFACLYPLTAGLIPGAVFGAIPRHAGSVDQIGLVSGIVIQGSFIGQLIGPPLLAFLVLKFSGWSGAVWMFPVLGGGCLLIAIAIGRLEARNSTMDR